METVNLLRPADYVDAERYEQEAQRVFRAGWLPACRADQVAQPDARFAVTLAGRPIVVTRAADGALHVLANVCQHRGADRRRARVFATAGTADKCAACERLGAERVINYRTEDFAAVVKELTGGKGVDVVLDMVGGDYVAKNLDCLAMDGRHVSIAFLKGQTVPLDLFLVMRKRLTLTGSTLRPRSLAEKAAIAAQLLEKVWPKLEEGAIRPLVHQTFPLAEADRTHALMESGEHIGKIALVVRKDSGGEKGTF